MSEANREVNFSQLSQAEFIENLYQEYLKHPETIDPSWRRFFEGMNFAQNMGSTPPKIASSDDLWAYQLIEAYRTWGHLIAESNPLELHKKAKVDSLNIETYPFKDKSLEVSTFNVLDKPKATVGSIHQKLKEVYTGSIGFEYMHIQNKDLREYIQKKVEGGLLKSLTKEEKLDTLHFLNRSELFETFLHTKYVGQKRFSIEGLETFIPMLRSIIDKGTEEGLDEVVICTAHRGRLNLLANIFEKPYSVLLYEFAENYIPTEEEGTGDVKYHKGYSSDIESRSGKRLHISIPPNSSHLESVNSIALGQVHAKQTHKEDKEKRRILCIQVHGDASISAQGVIYEDLQFADVDGYSVGGSLHVIMDNQIGFTTLPEEGRSTTYPSDIAKTFGMPIFHVNANDPEACTKAAFLAIEIRQKFHVDVFLHLIGYRKYGHNEGDEPSYTQPLEYQEIRKKESPRKIYQKKLVKEGVLTQSEADAQENEIKSALQVAMNESKNGKHMESEQIFGNRWSYWKESQLKNREQLFEPVDTRVSHEVLKQVAIKMTEIPEGFTPHKKIVQLLAMRRAAVIEPQEKPILDWGVVENLAYGTLLLEGYPIRISGQDCRRGTFSHRHAMIVDQKNAEKYFPLSHLSPEQGLFTVYNSPLSEYGCLGFEYGYSISTAKGLVIWEAQFGDFANGAQIIIDAYIASGEIKWNRLTNLVLLLPHGYEGQGPEHSSARVERFLQLSAQDNMFVAIPSTPAQLFHLLRRQVLKSYRKPLVVFTPKGLLRHPACVSKIEDLSEGCFQEIIADSNEQAELIIFCTGRVYYDIKTEMEKRKREDIVIVRIEQLYPMHRDKLEEVIRSHPKIKRCFWMQEEPKNKGAWHFIGPYLAHALPNGIRPEYRGRKAAASTSTGSHVVHRQELETMMKELFDEDTKS